MRTKSFEGMSDPTLPRYGTDPAQCDETIERADGLWTYGFSPWARKGSERKLWTEQSIARAIEYVLHGQGNDLPDFDD